MINETASFCIHGGLVKFGCSLCSNDKKMSERIEKLEKFEGYNDGLHSGMLKRIKNLEKEIDEINNGLIKRIGILGEALQGMSDENARLKYKPHRCPICDGKGKIQSFSNVVEPFEKREIDSLGRHFVICTACDEKGIVWSS